MTDEQHGLGQRLELGDLFQQQLGVSARRQMFGEREVFAQFKRFGDDVRRLGGAHKRAGEDDLEFQFHLLHGLGHAPEALFALGGQRPVGVFFKARFAAVHGQTVAEEEQVHDFLVWLRAPNGDAASLTCGYLGRPRPGDPGRGSSAASVMNSNWLRRGVLPFSEEAR